MSRFTWFLCASLLFACRPAAPLELSTASLPPISVPQAPETPQERAHDAALFKAAKQTFDQRCVVCHGCYDAPCQLILSSFEGVTRGASKDKVYEATRLRAALPSRLFIDGRSVPEWRDKGFHPVLPEGMERDPGGSLLLRMLELKREHPLPLGQGLPQGFELGLDREASCAAREEFPKYKEEHPLWGMPYALPGLDEQEHGSVTRWVEAGAPAAQLDTLHPDVLDSISRWEAFLNEPNPKSRLMARYIYEHLFLANLYLSDLQPADTEAESRTFFRLVRSHTPHGEAVDEIPTRRPFDDPGTSGFYYRFVRKHDTTLAKTNMPYALNDARMARWRELFLTPTYEVTELPSYEPEASANPFRAFHAIPASSRYRFMLDEAEFTMMGFIKGPVCRGQVALDVIQDRFWITFVDPDSPVLEAEDAFLSNVTDRLDLPAGDGSNGHLLSWLRYARNEKKYLEAKSQLLAKLAQVPGRVSLDLVWDGDGSNDNAALTVLRHYDSATVIKGFAGTAPKTAWLVSYAILERIHYLLVAGFDVFGNVGHQLNTRMYMDFLRMESEFNFLALLPKWRRRPLVDAWYRNVSGSVRDEVYGKIAQFNQDTDIAYKTRQPELELYEMLNSKLEPVRRAQRALEEEPDASARVALERLVASVGIAASLLPETSFLEVRRANQESVYFTILRDSSHTNVAHMFREDARRVPAEDRLSVLRGFVGAYPNALFSVAEAELAAFVESALALRDTNSYTLFHARFGVSRASPTFWSTLDAMHRAYAALAPLESGLFDLNRLDPN
ncbi:MAG: fatty acid cis/trans isomerase [Myxococcales bacterium]